MKQQFGNRSYDFVGCTSLIEHLSSNISAQVLSNCFVSFWGLKTAFGNWNRNEFYHHHRRRRRRRHFKQSWFIYFYLFNKVINISSRYRNTIDKNEM